MPDASTVGMGEKLTQFLDNVGSIGDFILGEIPNVSGVIQNDPMLFVTVGFLVVGGVIGIFGRLLSRR